MRMKNNVFAGALMLLCVCATAADDPLANDRAHNVIKAYTAAIVATYACRTTLDGGNGQYHQALNAAQEAFTRATNDRDKAKRMIAVLVKPRFYVSTSKSIIKALINMHSFEIQLSPIG